MASNRTLIALVLLPLSLTCFARDTERGRVLIASPATTAEKHDAHPDEKAPGRATATELADAVKNAETQFRPETKLSDCIGKEPDEGAERIDLRGMLLDLAHQSHSLLGKGPWNEKSGKRVEAALNELSLFPMLIAARAKTAQIAQAKIADSAWRNLTALAEAIKSEDGNFGPPSAPNEAIARALKSPRAPDATTRYNDTRSLSFNLLRALRETEQVLAEGWSKLDAVRTILDRLDTERKGLEEKRRKLLQRQEAGENVDEELERFRERYQELSEHRSALFNGYRSQPADLPPTVDRDRHVLAWLTGNRERMGRLDGLLERLTPIQRAFEDFQNNDYDPDHHLLHGYFLSKHAAQSPFVFSLVFTSDPQTGLPVFHSAALLRGRPRVGKAGNVLVTYLPASRDPTLRRGRESALHRQAAQRWLHDPEMAEERALFCSPPVLRYPASDSE